MASLVGTTIEWYDYFIYANAAALIFGPQFFSAVPRDMQLIVAFGTVGISFLFRPLRAAVAGHFGDRLGRKQMLVLTLLLMGGATAIIGLLPTAAAIGIWAPILLVLMRIIQGFSAGGEWGGAALMAVEHAPAHKRGRFGAFPQVGVLLFAGNGVAGYMVTGGFILAYSTSTLGLDRGVILNLVTIASATWMVTTGLGGWLADRIGRIRTYQIGFVLQLLWVFPLFMLINTQNYMWIGVAMVVLSIGLGLTYGPQSALFAEMFPARVRYSGASMGYAIGSILGGAFAPMIAQALVTQTGTTTSISAYLAGVTMIAFIATFFIKDRRGCRLDKDAMDIPGAAELERALQSKKL